MYSKFILLLLGFSIFALSPALAIQSEANVPVFLDTRLLVMVHPLFNAFDTNSGRFKGTSSEPIMGEYDGVEKVLEEVKKLQDHLLKSSERLRKELKTVPLTERISVERKFLAEKRELESKLEAMKMRVYMARLVPIKPGMTPYAAIYPQINDIMSAIRTVIKKIKEKYNTNVIIDIADLLPWAGNVKITQTLTENKHKQAFESKGDALPENYLEWLKEADQFWAAKLGVDAEIIPFGAVDVRLEAIKMMEEEVKGYKIWSW